MCVIAALLECFQEKAEDGIGMKIFASGLSVKRFERSNGLDTVLYKNKPLPFTFLLWGIQELSSFSQEYTKYAGGGGGGGQWPLYSFFKMLIMISFSSVSFSFSLCQG